MQALLACHYPQSGWVEQDPRNKDSQSKTIREALKKAAPTMKDIVVGGTTNQRETTIAWNRNTEKQLRLPSTGRRRRTVDGCEELKEGFNVF